MDREKSTLKDRRTTYNYYPMIKEGVCFHFGVKRHFCPHALIFCQEEDHENNFAESVCQINERISLVVGSRYTVISIIKKPLLRKGSTLSNRTAVRALQYFRRYFESLNYSERS